MQTSRLPISVLAVDDHAGFLHVLADFLCTSEVIFDVSTARDGTRALALATARQPDVALVDLVMSPLPGLELIPRLRELAPRTAIIALTWADAPTYRDAALAAGADELVAKSDLATDLIPTIWKLLADKGARSQ